MCTRHILHNEAIPKSNSGRQWLTIAAVGALVATFFMPTAGLAVHLCLFKWITGLPCPGCGLTRSITFLSQGDFHHALVYHPFGLVLYSVLVGAVVWPALPAGLRARILTTVNSRRFGYPFTVVFVTFAIWRMVEVASGNLQNIW